MGNVAKVFAQIKGNALTPEEISQKSGLSISKVKETLAFLDEFGFVKAYGSKVMVSDEIMNLPEG